MEYAKMYDYMYPMMGRVKKKQYEANMKEFIANYKYILVEMLDAEDFNQVANDFVEAVFRAFQKRGKIKANQQMDLNMFTIMYIFPAIQLLEDDRDIALCDALKKAWSGRFKGSDINYTDYETMYNGFNEKIFGIF